MHKKENMLLLVIPSQSHFDTHTKYEIETSEDNQAPPQKKKISKNDQWEAQRQDRNS